MAMPSTQLAGLEAFKAEIHDILSIPVLPSYGRALSLLDEAVEAAKQSSGNVASKATIDFCGPIRTHCISSIERLTREADIVERAVYRQSRSPSPSASQQKRGTSPGSAERRRGVVFEVDQGEHISGSLESLQLEEFLQEQEGQGKSPKRVHWTDDASQEQEQ